MTGELSSAAARRLSAKRRVAIDPASGPAVKRNVHEFIVDAPADVFARALAEMLVQPGADFAGLSLLRLPGRAGLPFIAGERFQAVFRLAGLRVVADSSEIESLELGATLRARYVYLEGGPFAGSSTFMAEPAGPGSSATRFTAVFELQERGLVGIALLHGFGLKLHDRVVAAQVEGAARRAGGKVLSSTVPGTTVPGTDDPAHRALQELPLR